MNPSLKKGDVVIIDKESKYKKGDIIAYYYQNMLIIHRITYETNCNDDLCIYTKGDQNKKEDPFLIQKNRILGKVIRKIPMIGYPTILIYSTFE